MSMLTLNGTVLNVYDSDERKDKKSGEIIPASTRVQIQCENTLQNGQKRMELHDLKVTNGEVFRKLLSRPVRIPVGVFATAGGGVLFYALNGGSGISE